MMAKETEEQKVGKYILIILFSFLVGMAVCTFIGFQINVENSTPDYGECLYNDVLIYGQWVCTTFDCVNCNECWFEWHVPVNLDETAVRTYCNKYHKRIEVIRE